MGVPEDRRFEEDDCDEEDGDGGQKGRKVSAFGEEMAGTPKRLQHMGQGLMKG